MGCEIFSTYGVTELANSLCECGAGAGGHLHDEQLHIEILDDDGKILPDGEIGEIVATTFGVEAMPLIRYRTGDCAALFSKKCKCGRTTPRIGPIVGRKNQKLKFKGASLFPSTLASVLEEMESVETFVIVARKESELSDSIEVLVHGAAKIEMLRDALQARAKIAPQLRHASRTEIEALQMPPQARQTKNLRGLAMKFCVVIPCFNHAATVAAVAQSAQNFCPVIVVDDGSTQPLPELPDCEIDPAGKKFRQRRGLARGFSTRD